jgi:transcriptional regulator with XRE-family HTH domain
VNTLKTKGHGMRGDESRRNEADRPLLRRFDERLNELIRALYPDERTRPGFARLAAEIREATGGAISATYLWELSTGRKRNVTLEQLDVLAEFFGVPPGYFLNEEVSERVRAQLALASSLRDAKVRNLALRSAGLSSVSLDAFLAMVNEARKVQNLPEIGDIEPEGSTAS